MSPLLSAIRQSADHLIQTGPLLDRASIMSFILQARSLKSHILPHKLQTQYLQLDLTTFSNSNASTISPESLRELQWWREESAKWFTQSCEIQRPNCHVYTDASKIGWGAVFPEFQSTANGKFPTNTLTSNWRELTAIRLSLNHFYTHLQPIDSQYYNITVHSDNSTACSYINNEGGIVAHLLKECKEILLECWSRRCLLRAEHISGKDNHVADRLSRL